MQIHFNVLLRIRVTCEFSRFPPELRMVFYMFVFDGKPDPDGGSTRIFTPLATCRAMYHEAVFVAYEHSRFHLKPAGSLSLGSGMKVLSSGLQTHLRYIKISIPIMKLDTTGIDNPFRLTQLPLKRLQICFTDDLKTAHPWTLARPQAYWKAEVKMWKVFLSAMLYRSKPGRMSWLSEDGEVEGRPYQPTTEICKSAYLRTKRRFELMTSNFQPTRTELFDVIKRSKARDIIVSIEDSVRDVLFSAFRSHGLVDSHFTQLIFEMKNKDTGRTKRKGIILAFYTQDGKNYVRFRKVKVAQETEEEPEEDAKEPQEEPEEDAEDAE